MRVSLLFYMDQKIYVKISIRVFHLAWGCLGDEFQGGTLQSPALFYLLLSIRDVYDK
jgi:hypothetical protein